MENKDNKKEIDKPFYKREAFVVSTIVFLIFMFFGTLQFLNSTETPDRTERIIPPTATLKVLPTATTTATTTSSSSTNPLLYSKFLDSILSKRTPKCDPAFGHCADSPIQSIPQEKSTADIVAEWQNRVARVSCELISNGGGVISQGSATLSNSRDSDGSIIMVAITNRHVIPGDYNDPGVCAIGIYGAGARGVVDPTAFMFGTTEDYAYINLDKASSVTETTWKSNISSSMRICSESSVRVGDDLIVLGYPAIGTQNGITVTSGKVSGIEKNYWVTDAKIDHGNSGGTAVLVKDDCYLGIPSASVTGTIESMGRILKASFVIN